MFSKKLFVVFSLLVIASMALAACQPQVIEKEKIVTQVVKETQLVEVEGTPQVQEVEKVVVVTATAEPATPAPDVEKTMIVCMAQEPSTLYTWSDTALVKSAVLEALYDFGADSLKYQYFPVGVVKLPNFEDGDAVMSEVEVKVGDKVYDAYTDEVITIEPTTTVNLNQVDGTVLTVVFSPTLGVESAKTVQLQVTWTLVDGLTWEDGTPVTTADILFSWKVGESPDTPSSKYTFERTTSFDVVDEKSWTWVTLPGYQSGTYFLDAIPQPLPNHVYGEGGTRPLTPAEMVQDEEVNRKPMAFGPFKVEEWVSGDHITLVQNPTYYRASEGLPKLDKLVYRFVADTNSLIAQLAAGECDLGTQDAAFDTALPLIRQFEEQGLLKFQLVAGTTYEHVDFNIMPVESYGGFANAVKNDDGSPIFANVEIRQAIVYCIDRQAVVDQTTNGASVVQSVYVPPEHYLYAGDANVTIIPFDPEKGKELMAKNGWTDSDGDGVLDKNGQKFSFVYSTRTNSLREKVTQVVQQQLKENCGIETTIALVGREFFDPGPEGMVFGRAYDFGEFAWLTGVEPPCSLYNTSGIPVEGNWGAQNNTGWSDEAFDSACAAAQAALDPKTKAEQHALAQKIFSDNVPSVILFARGKILVHRPNVEGVIMDATANSEMWNVENFDLVMP